jgi:hypothetical protein
MTGTMVFDGDAGSFETLAPTSATGITASLIKPVRVLGVATASGATSITLASTASAVLSFYVGWTVETYGAAAGAGQSRVITAYNQTTKAATVSAWGTTPTSTTPYILIPPFEGLEATEALIDVETYQVRFRLDGIAPTATVGHILPAGSSWILKGTRDLKNLKIIDTASGASSVKVTLFF